MDEIYSEMQIRGDLAFLKYAIRKNQVQLRPDTGLQKLINDFARNSYGLKDSKSIKDFFTQLEIDDKTILKENYL